VSRAVKLGLSKAGKQAKRLKYSEVIFRNILEQMLKTTDIDLDKAADADAAETDVSTQSCHDAV